MFKIFPTVKNYYIKGDFTIIGKNKVFFTTVSSQWFDGINIVKKKKPYIKEELTIFGENNKVFFQQFLHNDLKERIV